MNYIGNNIDKVYVYQGMEYTEEQVQTAAQNLGMTMVEYIEKYELKLKDELLGKPKTVVPGATAGNLIAPGSLDFSLGDSTSAYYQNPSTGTVADTLDLTEEEQENRKNVVSTLIGRTGRGVFNTIADIQSIPENLLYAATQVYDPNMTSDEKIAMKDAIENMTQYIPGLLGGSKTMRSVADAFGEGVRKYEDADIYTAIDNGNYADAIEMTIGGALESAPSIAAAYMGPGAIAVFGGSVASRKFDEELRRNPDEALGTIALNSLLTGANEAAGEILTRKLLFATKLVKGTGGATAAKEYLENSLMTFFKKYGIKPAGEGFSESLTESVNLLLDKLTLGRDFTWPEVRNTLVEAFTIGAFTGGAVNTVQDTYVKPMDRNLAENILMPSQTQFELRNSMANLSKFSYEAQQTDNPLEKAAYQDMMAEEEQKIVNLKIQNKLGINALKGDNLTEYAKNRDEIYKLEDLNSDENLALDVKTKNAQKIKNLNKRNEVILDNALDNSYENTLSATQEYARTLDLDLQEFKSQEQFDAFLDKMKGQKMVRRGVEGVFFPKQNLIVINKAATIESKNVNAPAHELLHAIMVRTIQSGEANAEALAEQVFDILKTRYSSEDVQDSEFTQRMQTYIARKDQGKKKLDQEVFTLFNDALANGDLSLTDSKLTELGDVIRRSLYSVGINRKFNQSGDVLNFLKDFNRSIRKGYVDKSVVRIANEGMQGRIISKDDTMNAEVGEQLSLSRQELVNKNKEILKEAGGAENLTTEQKAEIQENVRQIKNLEEASEVAPVEGVSKESIKRSEQTQKVYNEKGKSFESLQEIKKINLPFIKQTVNRYFKEYEGFKDRAIDKDTFEFYLTYGIDSKRTANSLYGLLNSYKPEMGTPLSQYIMQNLGNRAKGLLDQVIKTDVTVGSTDIADIVEPGTEMQVEELPIRGERTARDLGIKRTTYEDVEKDVVKILSTGKFPLYYTRPFASALQTQFRKAFGFKINETTLGKQKKYDDFVRKYIRGIYNTFTIEKVKTATKGDLRDILFENNKLKPFEQVRERLLEHYISPKSVLSEDINKRNIVSPQLKSQHKTTLAKQMADALGFQFANDLLQKNKTVQEGFRQSQALLDMNLQDVALKEIGERVVLNLQNKIRDIDFDQLESATADRIRKISRASEKLKGRKDYSKMTIQEMHSFFVKEFGLDFIDAGYMLATQAELENYVTTSEKLDRNKLKELYDEAEKATSQGLKVVYRKNNTETFTEYFREKDGIPEDDEYYSLTKKNIIDILRSHNMLPKGAAKMKKGELQDYMNNQVRIEHQKREKAAKGERTELEQRMNEILEESTGVEADKVFSKNLARDFETRKRFLRQISVIPPSAEDFTGLLYKTLSSGKKGEEQMKFYKEKLIDPFNKSTYAATKYKVGLMEKHKMLRRTLSAYKNGIKGAKQLAVDNFLSTKLKGTELTRENVVRIYLFRINGTLTLPTDLDSDGKPLGAKANMTDLTINEVNQAMEAINRPENKELKAFAESVGTMTKNVGPDGNQQLYIDYSTNWLGGTIGTDLLDYANGKKRQEIMAPFQDNVDAIFTEDTFNKLQALYGSWYVSALKSSLKRMKSGRNRSVSPDVQGQRFLDWVNGSVGTIMFFNMRSAMLQGISAINYLNLEDNNPIAAAKAMANVPQFTKDVVELFMDPYLKDRRGDLKMDVAADEIAQLAVDKNKLWRFIAKMQKAGFAPTRFMDSFAIATGGATFYRNRINKYLKEGMSESDAKEQAKLDWVAVSEESQQSARPDKISQLQSDTIAGRLLFAFANTNMQYARILKKKSLDLVNGRGNGKAHLANIMYYGAIQSILFNVLQSALNVFDPEDEKEKDNLQRAITGAVTGHARGIGPLGIVGVTSYNILNEFYLEPKATGKPYNLENLAIEATSFSPPIQSKLRNVIRAGRIWKYNQELYKMDVIGNKFTPEQVMNPRWMSYALVAQAFTNLPAARTLSKLQNIYIAANHNIEDYQRLLLLSGWDRWSLDLPPMYVQPVFKKSLGKKTTTKK